jgi:hypothetical protein
MQKHIKKTKKTKVMTKKPKARTKKYTSITQADYRALQKQWYEKLKRTGFNDLERFDSTGSPLPLLNGASLRHIADAFSLSTELYYRRMRNFVAHNGNWGFPDVIKMYVASMYAEGAPYRLISKEAKKQHLHCSLWLVHKIVKQLELDCVRWNKVSPNGLDFVSTIG